MAQVDSVEVIDDEAFIQVTAVPIAKLDRSNHVLLLSRESLTDRKSLTDREPLTEREISVIQEPSASQEPSSGNDSNNLTPESLNGSVESE